MFLSFFFIVRLRKKACLGKIMLQQQQKKLEKIRQDSIIVSLFVVGLVNKSQHRLGMGGGAQKKQPKPTQNPSKHPQVETETFPRETEFCRRLHSFLASRLGRRGRRGERGGRRCRPLVPTENPLRGCARQTERRTKTNGFTFSTPAWLKP